MQPCWSCPLLVIWSTTLQRKKHSKSPFSLWTSQTLSLWRDALRPPSPTPTPPFIHPPLIDTSLPTNFVYYTHYLWLIFFIQVFLTAFWLLTQSLAGWTRTREEGEENATWGINMQQQLERERKLRVGTELNSIYKELQRWMIQSITCPIWAVCFFCAHLNLTLLFLNSSTQKKLSLSVSA